MSDGPLHRRQLAAASSHPSAAAQDIIIHSITFGEADRPK